MHQQFFIVLYFLYKNTNFTFHHLFIFESQIINIKSQLVLEISGIRSVFLKLIILSGNSKLNGK